MLCFAYFRVSPKRNIKQSPNGMKPSGALVWNKHDPGDLEWTSRNNRGGHEVGERAYPTWACPPPSWAPRCYTDLVLPPIHIHIPRKHPGEPRKPNSTAATFCIREIPSWSLRRRSAGGGIDHGGPLHHLQGFSDEL